jgi:hypothetical protein
MEVQVRHGWECAGLALATALLLPGRVTAEAPKGAGRGRLVDAPDGQSQMEELSLAPSLADALLGVPLEGSLRIEEWPVAPGVRRAVVVTRHDVYAADAKIVAIVGGKEIEMPRSKLVFLWGTAEGDGATSTLITVDPAGGVVSGSSMTPDGAFDLLAPTVDRPAHLLARDGALRRSDPAGPSFECAFSDLPKDSAIALARATRSATALPQALSSMHSAVIAVDTDNELMGLKFADNTANATNYIAQLFAGITAIYERDLYVRLLQGYTVLRLSTTADPYLQNPGGNANLAKLTEVSDYWKANYSGVKRALLVMLSGKQPGNSTASGTAFIAGLCDVTRGVNFDQVFTSGQNAQAFEFQFIGHEIGHNFGSQHTHCTDTGAAAGTQPIDFCYPICSSPGQANCDTCNGLPQWSPNPGTSCPAPFTITPVNGAPVAGVSGTIMSYCHLLPGCSATSVFHPQTISLAVGANVNAAVNQCIFPIGNPAPTIASISPASGFTSGGSTVTITGTNFRAPASLAFADLMAGNAATGVVVVSPTTLKATTPAHSAGVKDVVVMNPDLQTATLKNGYTYVTPVTIATIAPNGGSTAGGTAVTITGSAFVAPAPVTLGGSAATSVNVASSSSITATTSAHAAGIVNVVVQSNGQSPSLASGYFYFTPAPPGNFYTLAPCRLVDTRDPNGPRGGPALVAGSNRSFTLTNACGIPAGTRAISVNLTVTGVMANGFISLFPGDGIAPPTSNVNFSSTQTRANNAVALLATDGSGSLVVFNGSAGTVHFILDVNGYFQ